MTITADVHEQISQELIDKTESREPNLWIIQGNHEDLGRTILKRENGVFSVEAEELSFVRGVA